MTPHPIEARAGISLRLRRRFAFPREAVFHAWTDPEALEQWWCPSGWTTTRIEVDLRVGGCFRIGMRKMEEKPPVFVFGRFLEVHRPEKLVFTWRWENAFPNTPETRVTVQLAEREGVTELVLIHEDLPEAGICLHHRSGWIAAWDRIDACCRALH